MTYTSVFFAQAMPVYRERIHKRTVIRVDISRIGRSRHSARWAFHPPLALEAYSSVESFKIYTHIYTSREGHIEREEHRESRGHHDAWRRFSLDGREMVWKKRSARPHRNATHVVAHVSRTPAPMRPHETLYFCLPNGRIRWRAVSEAAWRVHSFCKHLRPLYAPSDNPNT